MTVEPLRPVVRMSCSEARRKMGWTCGLIIMELWFMMMGVLLSGCRCFWDSAVMSAGRQGLVLLVRCEEFVEIRSFAVVTLVVISQLGCLCYCW